MENISVFKSWLIKKTCQQISSIKTPIWGVRLTMARQIFKKYLNEGK